MGLGRSFLCRRDPALFAHPLQHQTGPRQGRDKAAVLGQAGGRLGQGGQKGGFRQAELAGRFAEIGLRRRLDAVARFAQIGPVEIEGQDVVLGQHPLQLQRQHSLLHLAAKSLIRGKKNVPRQLLGQGRGALRDPPRLQIGERRSGHADGVDAGMIIETPVLRRQKGARHVGRQGVQGDRRAVPKSAPADQGAVAVQKGHPGRPVQRPKRRPVGQHRKIDQGDAPDIDAHHHRRQDSRRPQAEQPRRLAPQKSLGAQGQINTDRRLGRRIGWGAQGGRLSLARRVVGLTANPVY